MHGAAAAAGAAAGVYNTTQLRKLYSKPSMLVTKKADGKKMVPVYWPLKFKYL
jgi:hypothetical protein